MNTSGLPIYRIGNQVAVGQPPGYGNNGAGQQAMTVASLPPPQPPSPGSYGVYFAVPPGVNIPEYAHYPHGSQQYPAYAPTVDSNISQTSPPPIYMPPTSHTSPFRPNTPPNNTATQGTYTTYRSNTTPPMTNSVNYTNFSTSDYFENPYVPPMKKYYRGPPLFSVSNNAPISRTSQSYISQTYNGNNLSSTGSQIQYSGRTTPQSSHTPGPHVQSPVTQSYIGVYSDDQAMFLKDLNDKEKTNVPISTAEDLFKAKASKCGIEICTKKEQKEKVSERLAKNAQITRVVSEKLSEINADIFKQKASKYGIQIVNPNINVNQVEEQSEEEGQIGTIIEHEENQSVTVVEPEENQSVTVVETEGNQSVTVIEPEGNQTVTVIGPEGKQIVTLIESESEVVALKSDEQNIQSSLPHKELFKMIASHHGIKIQSPSPKKSKVLTVEKPDNEKPKMSIMHKFEEEMSKIQVDSDNAEIEDSFESALEDFSKSESSDFEEDDPLSDRSGILGNQVLHALTGSSCSPLATYTKKTKGVQNLSKSQCNDNVVVNQEQEVLSKSVSSEFKKELIENEEEFLREIAHKLVSDCIEMAYKDLIQQGYRLDSMESETTLYSWGHNRDEINEKSSNNSDIEEKMTNNDETSMTCETLIENVHEDLKQPSNRDEENVKSKQKTSTGDDTSCEAIVDSVHEDLKPSSNKYDKEVKSAQTVNNGDETCGTLVENVKEERSSNKELIDEKGVKSEIDESNSKKEFVDEEGLKSEIEENTVLSEKNSDVASDVTGLNPSVAEFKPRLENQNSNNNFESLDVDENVKNDILEWDVLKKEFKKLSMDDNKIESDSENSDFDSGKNKIITRQNLNPSTPEFTPMGNKGKGFTDLASSSSVHVNGLENCEIDSVEVSEPAGYVSSREGSSDSQCDPYEVQFDRSRTNSLTGLNPSSPEFKPSGLKFMKEYNQINAEAFTLPNMRAEAPIFQPSIHIRPHSVKKRQSSTQTESAEKIDQASNTRRVKQTNKQVETQSCDMKEVCINTVESLTNETSDYYVPPPEVTDSCIMTEPVKSADKGVMSQVEKEDKSSLTEENNDVYRILIKTQRELLRLRFQLCMGEINKQMEDLHKNKEKWLEIFSAVSERKRLEEIVDSRITSLKIETNILQSKLLMYEDQLNAGEIWQQVPSFSFSLPLGPCDIKVQNRKEKSPNPKKKMDRLSTSFVVTQNPLTGSKNAELELLSDRSNTVAELSSLSDSSKDAELSRLNDSSKDAEQNMLNDRFSSVFQRSTSPVFSKSPHKTFLADEALSKPKLDFGEKKSDNFCFGAKTTLNDDGDPVETSSLDESKHQASKRRESTSKRRESTDEEVASLMTNSQLTSAENTGHKIDTNFVGSLENHNELLEKDVKPNDNACSQLEIDDVKNVKTVYSNEHVPKTVNETTESILKDLNKETLLPSASTVSPHCTSTSSTNLTSQWDTVSLASTSLPSSLANTSLQSNLASTSLQSSLSSTSLPSNLASTSLQSCSASTSLQSSLSSTSLPPNPASTSLQSSPSSTSLPSSLESTSLPSVLSATTLQSNFGGVNLPLGLTSTSLPSSLASTSSPSTLASTSLPSSLASTSLPSSLASTSLPSNLASTSLPSSLTSSSSPASLLAASLPSSLASTRLSSSLSGTNILPCGTSLSSVSTISAIPLMSAPNPVRVSGPVPISGPRMVYPVPPPAQVVPVMMPGQVVIRNVGLPQQPRMLTPAVSAQLPLMSSLPVQGSVPPSFPYVPAQPGLMSAVPHVGLAPPSIPNQLPNFDNLNEMPNQNIDSLSKAKMPENVDPKLYDAVVQQLKQAYPDMAQNPTMLKAIAMQQTAVLQFYISSGNNPLEQKSGGNGAVSVHENQTISSVLTVSSSQSISTITSSVRPKSPLTLATSDLQSKVDEILMNDDSNVKAPPGFTKRPDSLPNLDDKKPARTKKEPVKPRNFLDDFTPSKSHSLNKVESSSSITSSKTSSVEGINSVVSTSSASSINAQQISKSSQDVGHESTKRVRTISGHSNSSSRSVTPPLNVLSNFQNLPPRLQKKTFGDHLSYIESSLNLKEGSDTNQNEDWENDIDPYAAPFVIPVASKPGKRPLLPTPTGFNSLARGGNRMPLLPDPVVEKPGLLPTPPGMQKLKNTVMPSSGKKSNSGQGKSSELDLFDNVEVLKSCERVTSWLNQQDQKEEKSLDSQKSETNGGTKISYAQLAAIGLPDKDSEVKTSPPPLEEYVGDITDIPMPKRKTNSKDGDGQGVKSEDASDGESWQQVTKKKKKPDASHASGTQGNKTAKKRHQSGEQSVEVAQKSSNFERLVAKLSEVFNGLNRADVIQVITDVRNTRGGLSGLTLKQIVDVAKTVVANRSKTSVKKNVKTPSPTNMGPSPVSPLQTIQSQTNVGPSRVATPTSSGFTPPFLRKSYDFSKLSANSDDDDEDICVICHDGLSAYETKALECQHVFHTRCINEWVFGRERTCPTCRRHALLPEEFPKLGKKK